MTDSISSFSGGYRFLSNFYPAQIWYDGRLYSTVEHAYQAAKTVEQAQRTFIQASETPGVAKRRGRTVSIRGDWEQIKIPIMRELLFQKFRTPELMISLVRTYPRQLIEGNSWGDTFWGCVPSSQEGWQGQNQLGKLLMEVRDYCIKMV
jgi:ribA/ribD-fused uncharacterized protein